MTPYELLAGTDGVGSRSNPFDVLLIDKNSEYGRVLMELLALDAELKGCVLGYQKALSDLQRKTHKSVSRDRKVPKFKHMRWDGPVLTDSFKQGPEGP